MTTATTRDPAPWARFVGDLTRPAETSGFVRGVAVAALIAAAVTAHVAGAIGATATIVSTVVLIVAGVVSHQRRDDSRPWLPLAVALVTTALLLQFTLTHASTPTPTELRSPLAELLLAMECCRAFALRTRRDLRFMLTSSAALVAVAASMSLSIDFALPLAAWAIVAATALGATHRQDIVAVSAARVGQESRRIRRLVAPLAVALAVAALAGTAVFLVAPAAQSSRLLAVTARLTGQNPVAQPGGLSNPSLGDANPGNGSDAGTSGPRDSFGYFGFSNTLDTGARGRPDDTLVMRVRASSPDFWRGQSFDTWNGRTWSMSDTRTAIIGGRTPILVRDLPDEPRVAAAEFIQTVFLETTGPNVIFGATRASQVYIPQSALFQLSDGTIRTGVELEAGSAYTVVSLRPFSTAARLRAAGHTAISAPEALKARYTTLPRIPERVAALAAQLAADSPSTYDTVRAMEAWMSQNTRYSLDIPPLPDGADAVEQFLFVDRTGFCEQIASSLVVMLRSQGIPARLAVGYAPGERNPFTGLFEVRAKDAHAWAEVYFPGVGWQAFDPTASVPLAGDPQVDAARAGLRSYLARHLGPVARPVLAALAALLAAVTVMALWRPIRRVLAARRRERSWTDLQLARLEALGAALDRPRDPAETAAEYAAVLERTVLRDARLSQVARAIEADAFGPRRGDRSDDAARHAVESTLDALENAATDRRPVATR